jgi:integrase
MRIREVFTVFPRSLKSGIMVYYYQTYDAEGKRQNARSTGKTLKTEAKAFCMKLFKEGLLIPEQKAPTFAEFSEGWWVVETCDYLKWRQLHNPITEATISMHKGYFENHIKEYFAKFKLDEITPLVIEGWLLHMSEKKEKRNKDEKDKKKLKPNTVNSVYGTLRLMMGEAFRKKLIKVNPCNEVKELKEVEAEREIFTLEEYYKLFPVKWSAVWDDEMICKANRLAACTGLRIGELRGLRGEHIYEDHIFVCGQYTRFGYSNHTKTKNNRKVPINPEMKDEFDRLARKNDQGYLFSDDGGKTPVTVDRIRRGFDKALGKIGISRAEKLERNLSFHAWRHFFNTFMRVRNVADSKVQSVTGHLTKKMTDKYTHFDTRKFNEVRDVQNELFLPPGKAKKPDDTGKKAGATKRNKPEKAKGKTAARKKADGKPGAKAAAKKKTASKPDVKAKAKKKTAA